MTTEPTLGAVQEYPWRLGQKVFIVQRMAKPLEELLFDPRNQRIQYALRSIGQNPVSTDQGSIYEALLKVERNHINKLYWQIVEAGGLVETLVVSADGIVIEGNCRLAALRRLCSDYPDEQAFCSPPCEVLPSDFDEEARLLYLGDCHVAGKQKWDAYEIAEHVYNMSTHLNKSHEFIARTLRLSKSTVGKYLDAYAMHTEFLHTYTSPGNIYKWSYFLEFQKRKQLRDRRREDAEFDARFAKWVEKGLLNRGEQVRQLPLLLDDEEVLTILDREGFKAAWGRYQQKIAVNGRDSFPVLEHAINELQNLSVQEMEVLSDPKSHGAALLRELHERIQVVARLTRLELEVSGSQDNE